MLTGSIIRIISFAVDMLRFEVNPPQIRIMVSCLVLLIMMYLIWLPNILKWEEYTSYICVM